MLLEWSLEVFLLASLSSECSHFVSGTSRMGVHSLPTGAARANTHRSINKYEYFSRKIKDFLGFYFLLNTCPSSRTVRLTRVTPHHQHHPQEQQNERVAITKSEVPQARQDPRLSRPRKAERFSCDAPLARQTEMAIA